MYRLTRRLLHTEMAKIAKQQLRTKTDNFRQAIKLIRLLNKGGNFPEALRLLHLLNKTGNLRRTIQLIRLLDRTDHFHQTIKFIRSLHEEDNFGFVFPLTPGHYSSPLPNYKEISARSQVLFDRSTTQCPGIELREEAQLELLESFSHYYKDLPFPTQPGETTRYYYENWWFGYGDAITLYSVLRHYEPRRVIEVGSGFSSAAMLDVNDLFLDGKVHFTFVEPHPKGGKRLLRLLTQDDKSKHTILRKQAQDVPLEVFQTLSANDILFIDSSHVGKVGSDVTHTLFRILPELKPGVIVHFHDIYWPFEYPEEYFSWMAWNEAYFLRAFLQFNEAFEVVYFSSFMAQRHADILRRKMPPCLEPFQYSLRGLQPGCSLWLRKVV